ncbi:MAG: hypothetical protein IJ325_11405, partial [Clostridia bacterium]|nr:hypothetical protein [Clostridia bacterium]
AGRDDSGDESGTGKDVTTQNLLRSKQRKTAVHQNDGSPFFRLWSNMWSRGFKRILRNLNMILK